MIWLQLFYRTLVWKGWQLKVNFWRKPMAIILTWKLWTMILMKRLRNWNKPWTKWDPRLSGCLSVGSTEREGQGSGDWQRWVIKGDNSMWPLLGVRLFILTLIETREVVIGQNSYYFTNHHFVFSLSAYRFRFIHGKMEPQRWNFHSFPIPLNLLHMIGTYGCI